MWWRCRTQHFIADRLQINCLTLFLYVSILPRYPKNTERKQLHSDLFDFHIKRRLNAGTICVLIWIFSFVRFVYACALFLFNVLFFPLCSIRFQSTFHNSSIFFAIHKILSVWFIASKLNIWALITWFHLLSLILCLFISEPNFERKKKTQRK